MFPAHTARSGRGMRDSMCSAGGVCMYGGGITGPAMFVPMFPKAGYRCSDTGTFRHTNTGAVMGMFGGLDTASVHSSISRFIGTVGRSRVVVFPNKFSTKSRPRKSTGFFTATFQGTGVARTMDELLSRHSKLTLNVYGKFRTLVGLKLIPCKRVRTRDRSSPALACGAVGHRVDGVMCAGIMAGGSP